MTFSDCDLQALSIKKDTAKIGLLQMVLSLLSGGHQAYFCFLHLSIQELLAAVHISHLSPKKQISVFQELFSTPRFSAVFQFYAGITKLRTSQTFISKLPQFLCPVPSSMYDLVKKIVKEEVGKSWGASKQLLISLLLCLYEAEDLSLCAFVASFLNQELYLTNNTLSPFQCLSIGYFLSAVSITVQGVFTVYLNGCSLGDLECKFLVQGFFKCHSHSRVTSQLRVKVWNNKIRLEGTQYIAKLLENTEAITHLDLSNNEFTDCSHIAAGLKKNKALKSLKLAHCELTDQSIESLSTGLNNYIEELSIDYNTAVTETGIKSFAKHLASLTRLKNLLIPEHLESSINQVFSEVNKERIRNGLHDIAVSGKLLCG